PYGPYGFVGSLCTSRDTFTARRHVIFYGGRSLIVRGGELFEARLVERFRQGDADALSTLFELHVDRVYAYARHILGSREDAEEVTSDAFHRAFRKAADFRGEAPFRGWVFGIARNLCRDRQRQPKLLLMA